MVALRDLPSEGIPILKYRNPSKYFWKGLLSIAYIGLKVNPKQMIRQIVNAISFNGHTNNGMLVGGFEHSADAQQLIVAPLMF